MDSEEEGRDLGEAVMDLVEVEMDSGEAAMVQLAPEVAAKVLPEAEETVVAVKVAAVMVKPESEVEVVTVKLAGEKMEVVMVQTEETATEEEGVEEEIRAPREAAASLAQLELAGEEIQEEEEEEIRAPREAMVQSLRLVLAVKLVVAVAEKEEVVAAATLRQFQPRAIVATAAVTLRQFQPRAIVATAVVKE